VIISYQRAKAESLGSTPRAVSWSAPSASSRSASGCCSTVLLIPILWGMLVLTPITAVQRFVKVWKQAEVAPVTAERHRDASIAVDRSPHAWLAPNDVAPGCPVGDA
jgi:CDP-diacylglycerol---glycerol-3-phosphate 3-phosphatidyltransferase